MWEVHFVRINDFLIISRLPDEALDDLKEYFNSVTETFDNLNSSVFCSSVIYEVQRHNIPDKNMFINYHIDSEEKVIRITSIDTS